MSKEVTTMFVLEGLFIIAILLVEKGRAGW
jgi:hypothetical protein